MTSDSVQPGLSDTNRLEAAYRRFDAANSLDPNLEIVEGIARPRELLYAERLTDWVLKLRPGASEALRLAARCQHLCRWMIARSSYPMTRSGYLKWREDAQIFIFYQAPRLFNMVPKRVLTSEQMADLRQCAGSIVE